MHFWINKGNQQGWRQGPIGACRRPPPLAVAAYYKRNNSRGYYPKPMVTPVRRFQSIESFANNVAPRRAPYFHNNYHSSRHHQQASPGVHYNNSRNHHTERSQESIQLGPRPQSPALGHIPTKYKCGFISLFLLLVLIVIVTNYYLSGNPFALGIEALLVICVLALILLIGGGWLFIFDESRPNSRTSPPRIRVQQSNSNSVSQNEQTITEDTVATQPLSSITNQEDACEAPPPPYHIAILLSPQSDLDAIEVINGDQSPPPSYEKAVT